jgi:hypothetical protein
MNENLKGKTYFEQISWGVWIWFFVAILCASIYLAIWAPLGNTPALVITLISIFGFYYLSLKMQTTTYIQDNFLYVNQAKIDLKYLINAKALNESEFKRVIGSDADPAAFLATNFWVKTGVKIDVKDKNDPTPYWLISSKKAVELAKKLS